MLTHLAITIFRAAVARESGDALSQFMWSVGFIVLTGVIAVVVGPQISEDWREFVGNPTP